MFKISRKGHLTVSISLKQTFEYSQAQNLIKNNQLKSAESLEFLNEW